MILFSSLFCFSFSFLLSHSHFGEADGSNAMETTPGHFKMKLPEFWIYLYWGVMCSRVCINEEHKKTDI